MNNDSAKEAREGKVPTTADEMRESVQKIRNDAEQLTQLSERHLRRQSEFCTEDLKVLKHLGIH